MMEVNHHELAELIEQAPRISEALDGADIPLVGSDGYELSLTERIIVAIERARAAKPLGE